ncbi:MAG: hypothetical protein EOP53_15005 [Sphingobacteriales bacterium]|nr:MAG: hypothetical protein EOP53_15005 [Sphingobacteriales bacterium]
MKRGSEAQSREARYFLFSQYFADGLRITLEILFPALLFSYYNHFEIGLTLSTGAFCASITDTPGPLFHKRNGMFFCSVLLFIVGVVTGFARLNVFTMGLEVVVFSFLFSMFLVYGNRAASVGSAALLIMILSMDRPMEMAEIWQYSALLTAGGIYYMIISLLFSQISPYRQAQRALGDCIREIAKFLRIKADFYSIKTDLEEDYRKLVAQHAVVSEKQDAVRELFFKSRQMVKEATSTSRVLILTFTEVIDLFEDILATYYDYKAIRDKYGDTGILNDMSVIIKQLARELDNIGFAIHSNVAYKRHVKFDEPLEKLKLRIDELSLSEKDSSVLILKKVLVNMRNLNHRLDSMLHYFTAKSTRRVNSSGVLDYSRFVSHQRFDIKLFRDNLTFSSAAFKHSLRMAIVCLVGFIVAKAIPFGDHSYWILLTIAFILKPAFSLTKQRNIQRIIGTIAGGIIGVIILLYVPNHNVQFAFMVFFMLGTYSFMRMNYILMVIFTTPFVLILFKILGLGFLGILEERILDTIIGCAIAFTASYLIFPTWESDQFKNLMQNVLRSNLKYLSVLADMLSGKNIAIADYKLARKDVYVSSANLSAAFLRMLSEPKNKQKNRKLIHQFVVINHVLTSNIASIASGLIVKDKNFYPMQELVPIRQSIATLNMSLQKLDPSFVEPIPEILPANNTVKTELNPDEKLLLEQLEFIHKVSHDIGKITEKLISSPESISA